MKILHIVIDRSIKPANSGTSLSLIEDRWMDERQTESAINLSIKTNST